MHRDFKMTLAPRSGIIFRQVSCFIKTLRRKIKEILQFFDRLSCTYTYLLGDKVSKNALLIDPVLELVDRDLALVNELGLEVCQISIYFHSAFLKLIIQRYLIYVFYSFFSSNTYSTLMFMLITSPVQVRLKNS